MMISPFDVWSPTFRAPFSGDVTQEIKPRFLSPTIKGSAAIEQTVQSEVASFGKQLGKILEALSELSEATDTPLPEIDQLITDIETVKTQSRADLRTEAAEALERLKSHDREAWVELTNSD